MTDEEKEHKNCYEQIIKEDGEKLFILDELKDAYLGKVYEYVLNTYKVMKENEQLKAQIENYQLAENEGNEIIAELKAHCKTVDEVNEKMKCCGNCINRGLEKNISFPCDRCKRWHRKENYNDYWELAE